MAAPVPMATSGIAVDEPTSTGDRDPGVGTPWHKPVPAGLEALQGD